MIVLQLVEILGGRHDQRRAHRSGGDAFHRDAGLDQRHGVAGHGVAQPHQRAEERAQQCLGQLVVAGLERVVERQRQVGGERERGRRVQRDADGPVGQLGGLGGRKTVEEQEVGVDVLGDGLHDAGHLVEIAGAVLEPDHVGDLGDGDGGVLGEPGVVAVVDDDGQVGRAGDGAGVVDQAGLRAPRRGTAAAAAGRRRRPPWRPRRSAWPGPPNHRHRRRRAPARRPPRRRCGRRRPNSCVLHGVEFSCAAGDEDTTGTGVHTLGDVVGQRVEIDVTGLGEGRDGEEQDAVKGGTHSRGS